MQEIIFIDLKRCAFHWKAYTTLKLQGWTVALRSPNSINGGIKGIFSSYVDFM